MAIEQLITCEKIVLQPEEQQRYEILKSIITFEKFLDKHKGNNYNIDIDGNNYSIPIEQLISVMQLPNEQFDNLCFNKEIKDINGIPKEYFIYAAFKFFRENKVIEEFLIPDNIIKRYVDIGSLQKIDLQAINKFLKTTDIKYKDIQIDKDLEQKIVSEIPENATVLELRINGFSSNDISVLLDKTPKQVTNAIFRINKRLKNYLSKNYKLISHCKI